MKEVLVFLLAGMLLIPAASYGGSVYSSGEIDDDLRFEDFKISDGYLTGSIINASRRTRTAVKLDMWTANTQETRIYWRKTLNLGDLAPGAKAAVKEPYAVDLEDPARTKFMFRVPTTANFRNPGAQTTQSSQPKVGTQQKQVTQPTQGAPQKQATPPKQGAQQKQGSQPKPQKP